MRSWREATHFPSTRACSVRSWPLIVFQTFRLKFSAVKVCVVINVSCLVLVTNSHLPIYILNLSEDFTPAPRPRTKEEEAVEPLPIPELPPHNGYGTHEDSAINCRTVFPFAPMKNYNQFFEKDKYGQAQLFLFQLWLNCYILVSWLVKACYAWLALLICMTVDYKD